MLEFKQLTPKKWDLLYKDNKIELSLKSSSITNKFNLVTDYITRVSEFHGDSFSEWLFNLLQLCENEEISNVTIIDSIDKLKQYSDEYLDSMEIDFSKFVDLTKTKKNSILFEADEIKKIIRLSSYLKIFSLISNNEKLTPGRNLCSIVYNKLSSEIEETDIAYKIHTVIKTKTYRYKHSDKYMWVFIHSVQCKDIDTHIIEIFNFIMNNIIILCEETKNPITYFVGVVDESVKWFLRSVYTGSIIYEDEISTEDIHGTHINNLRTYCYNDTLGRLKTIAFEKIYEYLEKNHVLTVGDELEKEIINFHKQLTSIKYISPLCSFLVFPLLSKMTKVPYNNFKTISPEHSAVLSFYLNRLLEKVFKSEYHNLFTLLDYFPDTRPSLTTTYTLKAIHPFVRIQDYVKNFFGFKTKKYPNKAISHYIGRISRVSFKQLLTGRKLSGIPLSKIELDMISFYTYYFADQLQSKIDELTTLMTNDF